MASDQRARLAYLASVAAITCWSARSGTHRARASSSRGHYIRLLAPSAVGVDSLRLVAWVAPAQATALQAWAAAANVTESHGSGRVLTAPFNSWDAETLRVAEVTGNTDWRVTVGFELPAGVRAAPAIHIRI
jgi:hypothetical protein